MNERIRELAKQVDCTIDDMGYSEGDIEGLAYALIKQEQFDYPSTLRRVVHTTVERFENKEVTTKEWALV